MSRGGMYMFVMLYFLLLVMCILVVSTSMWFVFMLWSVVVSVKVMLSFISVSSPPPSLSVRSSLVAE